MQNIHWFMRTYFVLCFDFLLFLFLFYSGVHRQALFITVGWFIGYHLTKYENYKYATLDRDMNEYIRLHPEAFQEKGNRTWKSSRISVLLSAALVCFLQIFKWLCMLPQYFHSHNFFISLSQTRTEDICRNCGAI